jgi:hypothetical protein
MSAPSRTATDDDSPTSSASCSRWGLRYFRQRQARQARQVGVPSSSTWGARANTRLSVTAFPSSTRVCRTHRADARLSAASRPTSRHPSAIRAERADHFQPALQGLQLHVLTRSGAGTMNGLAHPRSYLGSARPLRILGRASGRPLQLAHVRPRRASPGQHARPGLHRSDVGVHR